MTKHIGLYVHIPFCAKKCAYCDFASFAGRDKDMPPYVDRLTEEIARRARENYTIDTLYIGGGTPSLLPPDLMEKILFSLRQSFSFSLDAECSCECNPGTVTPEFLRALRRGGVNRLSFGVQASQPRLLSLLGRIHTWEDAVNSVQMARDAGFHNINLDLMLGLPTQTAADVEDTLNAVLSLSPTHLSCYGLIVEEGTKMRAMIDGGQWTLPEEDEERAMYDLCLRVLDKRGFIHYEISNFALPGFACRHNVDCWKRKEYLGVGSAACGFIGNVRYQNPPGLSDYLSGGQAEETYLSPEDAMFESVMLGLRVMEGVSEKEFEAMHGQSLRSVYGKRLEKPLRQGLVEFRDGYLRLTRRGMDVQNSVLVELL